MVEAITRQQVLNYRIRMQQLDRESGQLAETAVLSDPQAGHRLLDAPVKDVRARWPADAVEVSVGDERRWVLAEDDDALGADPVSVTRLLGPAAWNGS